MGIKNMKNNYLLLFILISSFISFSCKDWVTNVDPPINAINDSELNTESQLPFLINGVEIQFLVAYSQTDVSAADLSDAFFFDYHVPTEKNSSFDDINSGNVSLNNGEVHDDYVSLGQLRYYADDLIRRTNSIKVSNTATKNKALFTGYFLGGFARYLYATFYGLNQTEGGSPINNGPFINSDNMYDLAIVRFKESLPYAADSTMARAVNSVIAKAYLYKNEYDSAANFASKGLVKGDPDLKAISGLNFWKFNESKDFLLNMVADPRFESYIDADPNEANRIRVDTVKGSNDSIYYYQTEYPDSRLKIMTWAENNLMRAELILRGYGSGSAVELVNEVRTKYGLTPFPSVDLNTIYVERDKELFPSGDRLVDERRFNKWHLPSGTWEYLPIPQSERSGNPHLH